MAHNAGTDGPHIQASFDFLPQEMRHRLRFGDLLRAACADLRSQSRLIDRQVVGMGSRIAAARLREILRPAAELETAAASVDVTAAVGTRAQIPNEPTIAEHLGFSPASPPTADDLARQREILREIGTAVFYFHGETDTPPQLPAQAQRLHPRPLPARYFGAPPQQAGAGSATDGRASPLSRRKSA